MLNFFFAIYKLSTTVYILIWLYIYFLFIIDFVFYLDLIVGEAFRILMLIFTIYSL